MKTDAITPAEADQLIEDLSRKIGEMSRPPPTVYPLSPWAVEVLRERGWLPQPPDAAKPKGPTRPTRPKPPTKPKY